MNKILFLDSLASLGHINFNNIHLEALNRAGFIVDCIFPEGYSENLTIPNKFNVIEYKPKSALYKYWRFNVINFLEYVKRRLDLSDYDHIIHSSYDDMCLYITNFPRSLIIDHNNISKLDSKLRYFIFKLLSKRHKHISLSTEIQNYFNNKGIDSIFIPHGLVDPFKVNPLAESHKDNKYQIFIPSPGRSDKLALKSYFSNPNFQEFLISREIKIIMRTLDIDISCPNISFIRDRLSNEEYEQLFIQSDLIWIPYPPTFRNRVSGVLMEAIANQKDVLLPDINTFKQYKDFINPNSYYNTLNDMIFSIDEKINKPTPISLSNDLLKNLTPDYSVLIVNSSNS